MKLVRRTADPAAAEVRTRSRAAGRSGFPARGLFDEQLQLGVARLFVDERLGGRGGREALSARAGNQRDKAGKRGEAAEEVHAAQNRPFTPTVTVTKL
jgi:hypothetical protein